MQLRSAMKHTAPRRVLLVVENLPVPYDRRVWQEAVALKAAGFEVSVVSPATKLYPKLSEFLEGINVYRYPMLIEGKGYLGSDRANMCGALSVFSFGRSSLMCAADLGRSSSPIRQISSFRSSGCGGCSGKKTVFDHHDLTPELFATKFHRDRSIVLSFFYFAERRMLRARPQGHQHQRELQNNCHEAWDAGMRGCDRRAKRPGSCALFHSATRTATAKIGEISVGLSRRDRATGRR